MKRYLAAAAVVGAAIVLIALLITTRPGSDTDSRPELGTVSAIELEGFDGGDKVKLSSFEGKPLVLNYWASWCLFCIEEMPDFQTVYEEVADEVAFLGVNIQDSPSNAKDLLEVTEISYPVASDPEGDVYLDLGGRSMPTTVFVDERGEIVERFSGPLSATQLRERITHNFAI